MFDALALWVGRVVLGVVGVQAILCGILAVLAVWDMLSAARLRSRHRREVLAFQTAGPALRLVGTWEDEFDRGNPGPGRW